MDPGRIPCKYYARGTCRFGDNCRFYHAPIGTVSGAPYTYRSQFFLAKGPGQAPELYDELVDAIKKASRKLDEHREYFVDLLMTDLQSWVSRELWPLGSYSLVPGKPMLKMFSECIPMDYVLAQANLNQGQIPIYFQNKMAIAQKNIRLLAFNRDEARKVIVEYFGIPADLAFPVLEQPIYQGHFPMPNDYYKNNKSAPIWRPGNGPPALPPHLSKPHPRKEVMRGRPEDNEDYQNGSPFYLDEEDGIIPVDVYYKMANTQVSNGEDREGGMDLALSDISDTDFPEMSGLSDIAGPPSEISALSDISSDPLEFSDIEVELECEDDVYMTAESSEEKSDFDLTAEFEKLAANVNRYTYFLSSPMLRHKTSGNYNPIRIGKIVAYRKELTKDDLKFVEKVSR